MAALVRCAFAAFERCIAGLDGLPANTLYSVSISYSMKFLSKRRSSAQIHMFRTLISISAIQALLIDPIFANDAEPFLQKLGIGHLLAAISRLCQGATRGLPVLGKVHSSLISRCGAVMLWCMRWVRTWLSIFTISRNDDWALVPCPRVQSSCQDACSRIPVCALILENKRCELVKGSFLSTSLGIVPRLFI